MIELSGSNEDIKIMETKEHPNRILRYFADEYGVECAEMRLGHDRKFIITASDVPFVLTRTWNIDYSAHRKHKIYVHSYKPYARLHRFLLGVTNPKQYVDHANGDPLDNRRSNIRIATASQNAGNQIRRRKSATGFRGVYKVYNRYHARIKVNGQKLYLDSFATAEEAAMAYNWEALRTWGPFARINEILSLTKLGQVLTSYYSHV